jgi:hypothetical protein
MTETDQPSKIGFVMGFEMCVYKWTASAIGRSHTHTRHLCISVSLYLDPRSTLYEHTKTLYTPA